MDRKTLADQYADEAYYLLYKYNDQDATLRAIGLLLAARAVLDNIGEPDELKPPPVKSTKQIKHSFNWSE